MGDGRSDVGHVSFLVCQLRKRSLTWWFGILLMVVWYFSCGGLVFGYGGLVFFLWWFGICLWWFGICFMMA